MIGRRSPARATVIAEARLDDSQRIGEVTHARMV
jgi:hypothetical protein